jgi:hypothetical protein
VCVVDIDEGNNEGVCDDVLDMEKIVTLLYLQVTPVNIDAISPSQPVTSLYLQVTLVNIDTIDPRQPVTLQIPQAAPNKRAHNEAHGLLSNIDNLLRIFELLTFGPCDYLILSNLYLIFLSYQVTVTCHDHRSRPVT